MLRLYNSLSNTEEEFLPLEEGVVRLYTCGPTVYNYAHIGNFRTFVFQDLLRKYLKYSGYRVIHVMNITDVDDKTIKNARAQGMALKDYTALYTDAFFEDCEKLRIDTPDVTPRATEHIPEMVALIQTLEKKGCTYRKDGSIYFRIDSFPEYGKLSNADFSGAQVGVRVNTDKYDKANARDFVLWKAPREGEDFWETEIGPGRPGWHLECSAMSMKYLGETFDIHVGGIDLIFPHHENEIAQSECATGKPFVRWWIHPEFLIVEGDKMSKSLGNFFTLRDMETAGHSLEVIRYLLLSVHYRKQLNFTTDGLRQANAAIQRLEDFAQRAREKESLDDPTADFVVEIDTARRRFREAMDSDMNTSAALAAIFDFTHFAWRKDGQNDFTGGDARIALNFLKEIDGIFNILRERRELPDEEIAAEIEARQEARRHRNFAEADRIRQRLLEKGIQLEDTREGVRWKRVV